jgi:flagellar basal body-associated protein FliL
MAKEKDTKKMEAPEAKVSPKSKGDNTNKLFIMMFAGVIIIQLVIIIVAVYFFMNKDSGGSSKHDKTETVEKVAEKPTKESEPKEKAKEENEVLEGKVFSYTTKDIIINPKGTAGKRYLMTQVGIFVIDELMKKELAEEREAQVNGIINQYLAGKTINDLDNIEIRDSLALELKGKLNTEIPGNKIKKVYFSKFVIQ